MEANACAARTIVYFARREETVMSRAVWSFYMVEKFINFEF